MTMITHTKTLDEFIGASMREILLNPALYMKFNINESNNLELYLVDKNNTSEIQESDIKAIISFDKKKVKGLKKVKRINQ